MCVQEGSTALILSINNQDKKFARLLIEEGANLDIQDKVCQLICLVLSFCFSYLLKLIITPCLQSGCTALFCALINDQEEIVRLLIEKGANLDIQDNVCLLICLLLSLIWSFRLLYIFTQANNNTVCTVWLYCTTQCFEGI